MTRRPWTPSELAALRRRYSLETAETIASRLRRTLGSVRNMIGLLGLRKQRPRTQVNAAFLAEVRRLNADGWTDPEIARHLGCARPTVGDHRRSMGLPSRRPDARYRARVADRTREQVRSLGLRNLAEVRSLVWSAEVEASGWPAGLTRREVSILDALGTLPAGAARRRARGDLGRPARPAPGAGPGGGRHRPNSAGLGRVRSAHGPAR